MSFPRYAEYKDSGVEWLGEVPEHWDVVPFYGIAQERNESNKGMIENNLLSLSYGRIIRKDMSSNDGLLPESFETYQIVRMGDIVFRLTDLQNDKRSLRTAIVEEDGIITSAYLAANFFKGNKDFYKHLLRAYDLTKVFYSMGGGLRQSMKFIDVKRLPLLFPPISEQTTIAAFLDHETAKLDNLINEQKKLIELLKEKRQVVISHAVTKGLNPNAPMKDSGVEWLGKVPQGWEVKPLKTVILKIIDNRGRTPPFGDEGIAMLEVKQITEGLKYPSDSFEKFVPESTLKNFEREKVKENDILITTVGATSGKCVLVNKNPNYFIAQNVVGIRVISTVESTYLWYTMSSDFFYHSLIRINKSNTIDNLKVSIFINNLCTIPSLEEQTTIVAFLDQETARIDNLIQQAQKAITLLQERRTALISAAVTGKIDVRGFVKN